MGIDRSVSIKIKHLFLKPRKKRGEREKKKRRRRKGRIKKGKKGKNEGRNSQGENIMGDSFLYFNLDSTSLKEEALTQPLASSAGASKRLSQRHHLVWG